MGKETPATSSEEVKTETTNTHASADQKVENLIADEKKEQEEKVNQDTKKGLDGLLSNVISLVGIKLLAQKGQYSKEYVEYVTTKLEDMKKVGIGLKVKGFFASVGKFVGLMKTINPNGNAAKLNIDDLHTQTGGLIDKVTETEDKVNTIKSQIIGGEDSSMAAMLAHTEAEKSTLQALLTFETEIKELKKVATSPQDFQTKYHARLVTFMKDAGIGADMSNTTMDQKTENGGVETAVGVAGGGAALSLDKKYEGYAENSHYSDEEKDYINSVIQNAQEYEGTEYHYSGTSKSGIDCSGLWSQALKKEFKGVGDNFPRLTAALFDTKAPDIATNTVEKGDWMFWEDPKGIKKGGTNENGEKIYHIEMAIGKPYEKDGKQYVLTYGSSSDKGYIYKNNAKSDIANGVGYRERLIDSKKHHFAKPQYYGQLVAKSGKGEGAEHASTTDA